jgi:hypothetical protein
MLFTEQVALSAVEEGTDAPIDAAVKEEAAESRRLFQFPLNPFGLEVGAAACRRWRCSLRNCDSHRSIMSLAASSDMEDVLKACASRTTTILGSGDALRRTLDSKRSPVSAAPGRMSFVADADEVWLFTKPKTLWWIFRRGGRTSMDHSLNEEKKRCD